MALFYFTGGFMAQYDGSIRINTKIDSKQASAQLMTLENRIAKTADKIAGLRSKMDALKDAKIPTQEYSEISTQIQKAESEFNKFLEKQEQMQHEGKDNGVAWERLNEKMEEIGNTIRYAQGELQDLIDTGKAFTLGSDTEEFSKLGQQLQYAENDMAVLSRRHDELIAKQGKASGGYRKLGDVAKKSFNSVGNILKKANSHVNAFGKRLKEIAHRILPTFHKETKRTNTVLGQFSTRLKSLLSGMFIFNVISSYIRKMFSGVNEGFENFYNQNATFKSSVDSMRTSLLQLKNTFAAAFAPIVSVAIPYLEKLISYITKAINSIGQLIAALLGKKTYTKAIRVNVESLEETSDALEEVKEEAKEAEKALDGYLSPLDEINKYSEDKEIKVDIDMGKKPDASDIGDNIVDMFEEVPIDSYFLDLADKMKNIFSQLFAPLKEAWNREGKFVMDSWKYALKEVGDLIKSIGSDFLEVWQQEKTIKIFEDLLHIIGDIGLVVGNLAHNFRLAWEENETGKRILGGIRDIIGAIVANIRHAADATVEWSKNLNFSPLLTAIKGWIESLVPVFDNLSGIITDFYEKVLLPLGKWVLEKGLPELLQVFIDFNNKVDWEALRERLAQFWEHLEPFAETVGEGLIIFIERCANALADFINSPAFDNFLTMIENWMDSVSPEDVADALESIAKAIVSLKVAAMGFSAVSKGLSAFSKLADILKMFGAGGSASSVSGGLGSIASSVKKLATSFTMGLPGINGFTTGMVRFFNTLNPGAIGEIGLTIERFLQGSFLDTSTWEGIPKKINDKINGLIDFVGKGIVLVFGSLGEQLKRVFSWENTSAIFNSAKENFNKGGLSIVQGILEGIVGAFGIILEPINNLFGTFWDVICDVFGIHSPAESMKPIGKNILLGIIDGFKNMISEFTSAIQQWFDESVKPWFTVERWSELWESVKQSVLTKWGEIKATLITKVEEVKTSLFNAWESMKQTAIDAWSTVKETIVSIWQALSQNATEVWESIKLFFNDTWESIKTTVSEVWDGITAFLQEKWEHIKETVTAIFENVKTFLQETWEAIKEKIVEVWDSITERVSDAIQAVKKKISDVMNGIKEIWAGAWDAMKEKVTSIIDGVKDTIQSAFDWISEKVKSIADKLSSIGSKAKSVLGFGTSKKFSFTSSIFKKSSYSFAPMSLPEYQSPMLKALSTTPIPRLATGAVIPANKEFLAVLGDQKHGTNVEAPLDTIKQAQRESILEVLSELGIMGSRSNNNSQTIIIKQYLDGKQVAESVVKEGKVRQMATGSNMFMLGAT